MEIKSIRKAIDILCLFAKEARDLSTTEIAQQLGMTKSTVSRILSTLADGQLVVQSNSTRKYHFGGKILEFAGVLLSTLDVRFIASPYARKIQTTINETVYMYVLEDDHRVCIDFVQSTREILSFISIGHKGPLHAGASGKVLLAFQPDDVRDNLLQRIELVPYTKKTIASKDILRKELDKIRKQGFAVSIEEVLDQFNSVAAPILDYEGKVLASLGISGLKSRFRPPIIKEYAKLLTEVTATISREMGYGGLK